LTVAGKNGFFWGMLKDKATVLCIDDDEVFRHTVQGTLGDSGYKVLTASSGEEGLKLYRSEHPDVLLVDLRMSGLDGFEVLSAVRLESPETAVLVVSGEGGMVDVIEALRRGAWDYITKSLKNISLLELHIERALERASLMSENRRYQENLEQALRDKERYRRNLEITFQNIPDGLVTVNGDLRIIHFNSAIQEIWPPEVPLEPGVSLREAFGNDCKEYIEALERTLETGEQVLDMRVEWPHVAGMNKVVRLTTSPLLDEKDEYEGAVLVVRDVSRQAEMEQQLREKHRFGNIVGKSPRMLQIYSLLEQLSQVDTSVLITGESGTGKELVVDALHYNGPRSDFPLVKVNCAALSEDLLESELFGHVRGAFTGAVRDKVGRFEAAQGGTIFLDEIGDISPGLQLKLLRVLETKQFERVGSTRTHDVDVRLVTATNVDFAQKVQSGLFREDLYYRLKVMPIHLPPLRERTEDIPLLVRHFRKHFQHTFSKSINGVSDKVLALFMRYPWPGNVRELKHAMEHACLLCRGDMICLEDLPADLVDFEKRGNVRMRAPLSEEVQKRQIAEALDRAEGNKARAARILGINRKTLYRKLHKFGIPLQ